MPTVLRIVIDTVTSGSVQREDHHQEHRSDVAYRHGHLSGVPDSDVFDSKTGDEKVAAPEADERAGEGCDVASVPQVCTNPLQYAASVKLRLKSRHRIATRTTHGAALGSGRATRA